MSPKIVLVILSIIVLFQLSLCQYKAPLYMGFLMPKKYVRNLTNMQLKSRPNCGSICPQQQTMIGQNFNSPDQQDNVLAPNNLPSQFNSYGPSANNELKIQLPAPNWEKVVQNFNSNNFLPTNGQNKNTQVVKFLCCNTVANNRNQNNNEDGSQAPIPQYNSYVNGFNRNNNLYSKSQWDSSAFPSFDQWVRQQPQDSPFILYTGNQLQQRQSFYPTLEQFNNGENFSARNYVNSQFGFQKKEK